MLGRRKFLRALTGGAVTFMAMGNSSRGWAGPRMDENSKGISSTSSDSKSRVSLVKANDREHGVRTAISLLGINPVEGTQVLLKPNFNSSDPFPASTHNDTLEHLIRQLQGMGAAGITIGERCGPGDTAEVMREKGIYSLAADLGAEVLNFEELPERDWIRVTPAQSRWADGFYVARPVMDSRCIVTTCCLKTHFIGVFTLSLKLAVGMTHKGDMQELHSSPDILEMIADINQAYTPSLILLDGMEAFVDGGPAFGTRKAAGVMLAGTDRVAVDAVGLAVLKELGSNEDIMQRRIFEQVQIRRAVQLGLGAKGPDDIVILAEGDESQSYANTLREILARG